MIFSGDDEAEMDRHLSRGGAQTFVDTVYEVRAYHEVIGFDSNLRISSIRHLAAFLQGSAGGVYAIYAEFVVAVPCFRGH